MNNYHNIQYACIRHPLKYNAVTVKMVKESETKTLKSLKILIPGLLFPAEFTSLYVSPTGEFWKQDVTSNKASLRLCILLKDEISLVRTRTSREQDMGPRPT